MTTPSDSSTSQAWRPPTHEELLLALAMAVAENAPHPRNWWVEWWNEFTTPAAPATQEVAPVEPLPRVRPELVTAIEQMPCDVLRTRTLRALESLGGARLRAKRLVDGRQRDLNWEQVVAHIRAIYLAPCEVSDGGAG